MTPRRLAAASVGCLVLAAAVPVVAVPSFAVWVVAIAAVLLGAAGTLVGVHLLVAVGGLGVIAAGSIAVGTDAAAGGPLVVLVAPLLWCGVELGLRSIEVRPATQVDPIPAARWAAWVAGIAVATVAFGLVVTLAAPAVPDGGLTFRVLAMLGVVVAAGTLALADLSATRRRATARARATGSSGRRPPSNDVPRR